MGGGGLQERDVHVLCRRHLSVLHEPRTGAVAYPIRESAFLDHTQAEELSGQVDDVCFAQGLVLYDDSWFLYYGMADSRIGYATAPVRGT